MAYPTLGLTLAPLPYARVDEIITEFFPPEPPPEPSPEPSPVPDVPELELEEPGFVAIDEIETLCAPGYVLTPAGTCVPEERVRIWRPRLPEPMEPTIPEGPEVIPEIPVPAPPLDVGKILPLALAAAGFLFLR
ncbi:MAG: hypothetical protein V3T65_06905 [Acidobacteriota bacterium]